MGERRRRHARPGAPLSEAATVHLQAASLTVNAVVVRASRRWEEGTFFNKPLAGAVRTILEAAFEAKGAAAPLSVDEIRDALTQGSYDFGNGDLEAQKQGIRISLGKNSVTFVKLPNSDKFGLVDWYGLRRRTRPRLAESLASDAATDDQSADDQSASTDADGVGVEEEAAGSPAAPQSMRIRRIGTEP